MTYVCPQCFDVTRAAETIVEGSEPGCGSCNSEAMDVPMLSLQTFLQTSTVDSLSEYLDDWNKSSADFQWRYHRMKRKRIEFFLRMLRKREGRPVPPPKQTPLPAALSLYRRLGGKAGAPKVAAAFSAAPVDVRNRALEFFHGATNEAVRERFWQRLEADPLKSVEALADCANSWTLLDRVSKWTVPLEPIIDALSTDALAVRRRASAELAGRHDHPHALAVLRRLSMDSDPTVRASAVSGLARRSESDPLLRSSIVPFLADLDEEVGQTAAQAFQGAGSIPPGLIDALIALFESKPHAQANVISALWKLGPEAAGAVPFIGRVLPRLRGETATTALFALDAIRTLEAIAILAEAARTHPRGTIRIEAIHRLGDRVKAAEKLILLRGVLKEAEQESLTMALFALMEMGPPAAAAVPDVLTIFKTAPPETRGYAAETLAAISDGNTEIVDVLLEASKNPDPDISQSAEDALARLRERSQEN